MNILSQLIKDNYILMTLVHMAFDILHNVFTIAACLLLPPVGYLYITKLCGLALQTESYQT